MFTIRDYVDATWASDERWQVDHFADSFDPTSWTIIMGDDLDAGGFVVIAREIEILLSRLFVSPDFQCRGIGTAIVRSLISKAQRVDIPLKLDVLKSNPDAKRLYENLGLKVIDEAPERYHMSTRTSLGS